MSANSQIYLRLPTGTTRSQVMARWSEPLRPHTSIATTPDDGLSVTYRSAAERSLGALQEAGLLVAMLLPLPLAEIGVFGAFLQHGEFPAYVALQAAIAVMPAGWLAFVLTDANDDMFICAVCGGGESDDVLALLADIAKNFQR